MNQRQVMLEWRIVIYVFVTDNVIAEKLDNNVEPIHQYGLRNFFNSWCIEMTSKCWSELTMTLEKAMNPIID